VGRNLPAPTDGQVYQLIRKELVDLLVQEVWTDMKKGVKPTDIWDMVRKRAVALFHKKIVPDVLNEIQNRPLT
jgi:hypothetical protein